MAINLPSYDGIPSEFCSNGNANIIPAVQETEGNGLASFNDGFPVETAVPLSEGGVPPSREDMNGVLKVATQPMWILQQGGYFTFNQSVCNKIGGYPIGAVLKRIKTSNGKQFIDYVISKKSNNYTNFNLEGWEDGIDWDIITTEQNDYIVENWRSEDGYTWYRLWKSGWVEQGGRVSVAGGGYLTITFPIAFRDAKYIRFTNYNFDSGGDSVLNDREGSILGNPDSPETSARIYTAPGDVPSDGHRDWYVAGFAAENGWIPYLGLSGKIVIVGTGDKDGVYEVNAERTAFVGTNPFTETEQSVTPSYTYDSQTDSYSVYWTISGDGEDIVSSTKTIEDRTESADIYSVTWSDNTIAKAYIDGGVAIVKHATDTVRTGVFVGESSTPWTYQKYNSDGTVTGLKGTVVREQPGTHNVWMLYWKINNTIVSSEYGENDYRYPWNCDQDYGYAITKG